MRTVIQITLEDEQDILGIAKEHTETGLSEEEMKAEVIKQIKENKVAEVTADSFNQMLKTIIHVNETSKQKAYVSSVDCYSNSDDNSLLDSWKVGIANEN